MGISSFCIIGISRENFQIRRVKVRTTAEKLLKRSTVIGISKNEAKVAKQNKQCRKNSQASGDITIFLSRLSLAHTSHEMTSRITMMKKKNNFIRANPSS